MEGARDDLGKARRVVDFRRPFDDGAESRAIIQLLKRLAFAHPAFDLADEQDHGRRILLGDVQAGRRVGGPRTARHEADPRTAGELAMRLRHHGGAAFLAADRHGDVGVMQRVERRQITLAGDAENVIHPLGKKLIDKDLAAGAGGRCHGGLVVLRGEG